MKKLETKNIFTTRELELMGVVTKDEIIKAVRKGDDDKAIRLADRMYQEFLAMHDLYRDWITGTLSWIRKRYGDVVLRESLLEGVGAWTKRFNDKFDALKNNEEYFKIRVKMFISGLRGHLGPLKVSEDAKSVTIEMIPYCWSGGRLIEEGAYERKDGYAIIEDPQDMSFGRKKFPVYCAHVAIHEILDVDREGRPFAILEKGKCMGDGCCMVKIYKEKCDVPERYYVRIGKNNDIGGK